MASLKIGSLNTWGLGDDIKRREVFTWLRQKQLNIYFLQETKCLKDKEKIWETEWGYRCIFNSANTSAQGVAILFNPNFQFDIIDVKKDFLGRYIIAHIKIGEENIILANIYGPNNDNPIFFQNLFHDLEIYQEFPTVLGGDYNICLDKLDKTGGRPFHLSHPLARKTLLENLDTFQLVDSWRILHPQEKEFTWRQRNTGIACRLDFFLVSVGLLDQIENNKITHGYRSDHSFISINFETQKQMRGPGFFKLNTSLLLQQEYVQMIKTLINVKKQEYTQQNVPPDLLWETIKSDIRGETIKFSSKQKKNDTKRKTAIEHELEKLEKVQDIVNSEYCDNKIQNLKLELSDIINKQTNGILTRAKARWLQDGEKNSKYFFGLEKRNYMNKNIHCLINDKGEKITNFTDISKEQNAFYEKLYQEQEVSIEDEEIIKNFFIESETVPKLNEDMKIMCEGQITNEECKDAIKSMQNFKSPGTDGLQIEFYKIFWNDVSDLVLNSFKTSYSKQEMSISQKQSIITLLPKKDKDTKYLKNWRPISLLNTDYKIMTKCIANRLKKVLPHIIHSNQTGFLQNRYIGSNIRLLLDIIDYTEYENKPGLIFTVDFEKAFDSFSWKFLDKVLAYFNFGESFKTWINTFHTNISSCILNNGWSSEFFYIKRGARQGCPISPYLFLLCAEILGIGIRHSQTIKGIKIKEEMFIIAQFADDTQIILDGSSESLNETIKLLQNFEEISGLKVNFEKSELVKLGTLKGQNINMTKDIKIAEESFKVLGINIPINGNFKKLTDLNFKPAVQKIKNIINSWSKRSLTLIGKTVIIKTLILPQFLYQLTNLPSPPNEMMNEIDDTIFKFLWDGKRAKIKRSQLYLDSSKGGLGIPNIFAYSHSLKIKWLKYLLDSSFIGDWKRLFLIQNKHLDLLYKSNISCKDVKHLHVKSKFWNDVLCSWAKIHYVEKVDVSLNSRHPGMFLWYNSNLKINGKPIYYKQWHLKGINYVKDLFGDNLNFLTFEEFSKKYNHHQNFLEYYSLVETIRALDIPVTARSCDEDTMTNKLTKNVNTSKTFYCEFLKLVNQNTRRNCFSKWENMIENDIDWEETFTNIFKYTNDVKLRNFQFKLIHDIFPDNRILHKIGKIDSDKCDFCKTNRDSVQHYLWFCNKVQEYWSSVELLLQEATGLEISLNLQTILFGGNFSNNYNLNIMVNFIILVAKHHLHCCKWRKGNPNRSTLLTLLKNRERIEKINAFKNNNLAKHESKWEITKNILNTNTHENI